MINLEKGKILIVKINDDKQYQFEITKIGRKYIYGEIIYTAFNRDYCKLLKDNLQSVDGKFKIIDEY